MYSKVHAVGWIEAVNRTLCFLPASIVLNAFRAKSRNILSLTWHGHEQGIPQFALCDKSAFILGYFGYKVAGRCVNRVWRYSRTEEKRTCSMSTRRCLDLHLVGHPKVTRFKRQSLKFTLQEAILRKNCQLASQHVKLEQCNNKSLKSRMLVAASQRTY